MDVRIPRGLPARQARFLCLLAVRPSMTRADYQRLLGVSICTAKRDLAELMAANLVVPVGNTRARRYYLAQHVALTVSKPKGDDAPSAADAGAQLSGSDSAHICITIDPGSLRAPYR